MGRSLFDLTGKTALITGGNGGIGLGMAKVLAEHGADLVIWGTNPEKNAVAEAELKAIGRRVLVQRVDVADEAAVDAAMDEAVATMGAVHAVFANAAINAAMGPFAELDMAAFHKVMAVNLHGVTHTLRAGCRHMLARGEGGSLVAVSSIGALKAAAFVGAYIASKAALHGLVRAIAVEHAVNGIRANTLVPGWVATEINRDRWQDEAVSKAITARVPARRWGQPEDLGGVAVYLASDASRFHTGDTLRLDGGYGAC